MPFIGINAFLLFSFIGTLLLYLILRIQQFLPWCDATYQNNEPDP